MITAQTKNAPVLLEQGEGRNQIHPSGRNQNMLSVADTQPVLIDTARAALDQIQSQIAEILATRAGLLQRCRTDLIEAGIDARIVEHGPSRGATVDDVVVCYDAYERLDSGRLLHRTSCYVPSPHRAVRPSVWQSGGSLKLTRGFYRVVLIDGRDWLLAQEPGAEANEHDRRKDIARLRTLARSEDLRIRVRGLTITVTDPLGTPLHEGDVVTSFAWILGLDIEGVEYW